MGGERSDGWVQVDVPPWVYGNSPTALLDQARLVSRVDVVDGVTTWRIKTDEGYRHQRGAFVESWPLALIDGSLNAESARHVADLVDEAIDGPTIARVLPRAEEERKRMPQRAMPAWAHSTLIDVATSIGADELGRAIAENVEALRQMRVADTGEQPFEWATAWIVSRPMALPMRVRFMALLVRLQADTRLAAGVTQSVRAELARGGRAFASSSALIEGTSLLDLYLAPLVGALTPSVWGVLAHRTNGTILFSFGRAMPGTAPSPQGLLDTIHKPAPTASHDVPDFASRDTPTHAIQWWSSALNSLFEWLTDPALFADTQGSYDPVRQMQTLASVEQVFRRTVSIQTLHRDLTARATLMFSVLDTLEGLARHGKRKLYSAEHADGVLRRLEASLGPAGEILLPAARRAVEALRSTADGFFLRDDDGKVPLRPNSAAAEPQVATEDYLVMLRNAVHGFGSPRKDQRAIDASLMSRHDGTIPEDLPLLAWLYLLDVLDNPARMRKVIGSSRG